jgi:hypothetical protein
MGSAFLHFSGSGFLTFWLLRFASLRAPGFHFSGSGFYPFHYLGFASVWALLLGHQNVQEILCANIYNECVRETVGPSLEKLGGDRILMGPQVK